MNTFLVQIEHVDYIGELKLIGTIGKPTSMPDLLILKTEESIERVRQCKGVIAVEDVLL